MAVDIGTLKGQIVLDDKFSSKLTISAGKLDQIGKKWESVGGKIAATGASLTRSITLPLLAVGGGALVAAAKFETSMTKMETLVGLTREEVQGFRADIMALSGQTARAPKELADAMFFITSAGIRGSDALDTLRISAQAAAIGLGQTEVIADAVTSAMNAYAKQGLTAADATNILAGAVRAGKLEATALAPVLGNLLPAAASLGIAFEDVAGVLAVMSKTGLDAANASTSLNAIMTTLRSSSPEAAKVLASVGLSMAGLRDVAAQPGGLIEVMRILEDKLGDNVDAFSTVIPNIRAAKGAFTILAQEASSVDAVMDQVAAKTDIVGAGMQRVAETTGFKFNQFLAKLTSVGVELGDTLVPAFTALLGGVVLFLDGFGLVVKAFDLLPGPIKSGAAALLLFGIAIGPLMSIGGNLLVTFGKLAISLGTMTGFIAADTAATTLNTGALTANSRARLLQNVAIGGGVSKLGKLINILPAFSTKMIQGRNATGQFTKSFKVFDASFLKTKITLAGTKTAFIGALGSIKKFGLAMGPKLVGGVKAAGLAIKAVGVAFTGLSIGILAPVGIVAALAIFSVKIAKAGADAEEAAFKLAELNGAMVNGALAVNDVRLAWQEAGEKGLQALLDTMDPAIIKSQEFSQQLGDLLSSGRVTKEEFQGISDAVFKYREQMELAVQPTIDVANAGTTAAQALEELHEILDGLGVTTAPQAMTAISELTAAMESGLVPPEQMITLLDSMAESFDELGLHGIPEIEAALQRMNSQWETTGGILDTVISKQNRIGIMLDNMPPFIDDVGISAKDMAANWDDVGFSLKGVEPPFRAVGDILGDLGIKIPDVATEMENLTRVTMSGEAPVRQMVEAIRSQRDEYERLGVLTPDLNKKLNELEKTALQNATAADRAALGFKGLFDGLKTGIPFIDKLLGKFSGVLGIFGKLTGALASLGGKFGDFFSKIGGGLSSLFGGGGGGGGGGISGLFSGIQGLFSGGSKGETVLKIAAKDFSKTLTGEVSDNIQKSGFFSKISGFMSGKGGQAAGAFFGQFASALASGASKLEAGLIGALSVGLNFIPVIGPILSQFAGPLFKGLKAIGAKVGSFFKGIFGGPDKAELQARKIGNSLNDVFRSMLDASLLAEAQAAAVGTANDQWAVSNVAVANAYLAVGLTAEQAAAASDRLTDSVRKSPAEAQAAADAIKAVIDRVQAALATTGLGLLDLRILAINSANVMGVSVAAAFEMIADGTIKNMADAQAAVQKSNEEIVESVSTTTKAATKILISAANDDLKIATTLRDDKIAAQQDVVLNAELMNNTLVEKAKFAADRIRLTMRAGLRGVERDLMSVSDTGAGAFESTADAADLAANEAEDRFSEMRRRLTGASIIPNMVNEANTQILTIGDAAGEAANKLTSAFSGVDIGDEIGRIKDKLKTATGEDRARLDRRLDQLEGVGRGGGRTSTTARGGGDPDERRRKRARFRGGDSIPMTIERDGNREAAKFIVDGQLLATAVIKAEPRALGNRGLRRGR